MVRVLVVARTQWGPGAVCIGVLALDNGRTFRLKTKDGNKTPESTACQVGDEWEMELRPMPPHGPFTDDAAVHAMKRIGNNPNPVAEIEKRCKIIEGTFDDLFEGHLQANSNGKRCIPGDAPLLTYHVQFWRPTISLELHEVTKFSGRTGLEFSDADGNAVAYVGTTVPPAHVAAGGLVRVSLADRAPNKDINDYWLQLSHVY